MFFARNLRCHMERSSLVGSAPARTDGTDRRIDGTNGADGTRGAPQDNRQAMCTSFLSSRRAVYSERIAWVEIPMTPALDPKQEKIGEPGRNLGRDTSKSAPVLETFISGIGFYPQGVRPIGVWALGPLLAILMFYHQMVPR